MHPHHPAAAEPAPAGQSCWHPHLKGAQEPWPRDLKGTTDPSNTVQRGTTFPSPVPPGCKTHLGPIHEQKHPSASTAPCSTIHLQSLKPNSFPLWGTGGFYNLSKCPDQVPSLLLSLQQTGSTCREITCCWFSSCRALCHIGASTWQYGPHSCGKYPVTPT